MMNINKMKYLLATVLLMFGVSAWAASSSPIATMQQVASTVLRSLSKNQSRLKNRAVLDHIVNTKFMPYVAETRMAQLVVGRRYWNRSTAAQKKAFIQQFKATVVTTYSAALADYNGDKIRIYPLRGGVGNRSNVVVKTVLVRKSGRVIPISYSLMKVGGAWKIYDFSVENISLVSSYRSQFAPALASGGMRGLIAQLAKHNRSN